MERERSDRSQLGERSTTVEIGRFAPVPVLFAAYVSRCFVSRKTFIVTISARDSFAGFRESALKSR